MHTGNCFGHHSFAAEFDANKPVTLEGVIARVNWINPHVTIYLDVKSPNGTLANWSVEAGSPNSLSRRGLSRLSLEPGTNVVIEGYRSRSVANRATGSRITLPGGLRILLDQHESATVTNH